MKLMKRGDGAGGCGSGLGVMLGAVLVAVAGFSSGTAAQTLTTLYSFAGPPSDGATPTAGLIAGAAGDLYGTTEFGGGSGCQSPIGNGCGIVFKLTPSGTETVLHSFTGSPSDGANPFAGLIAHAAGNLYGTTALGGASDDGTVFKLMPSGTETVLYSFTGSPSDGAIPTAGLIADPAGNLFSTTHVGGASGDGTVFKLTRSGTETVLHSFTGGGDGAISTAGLIPDPAGKLFSTTHVGGASGNGTVFKLTRSGTETVLHSFTGGGDGAVPIAGLIADAAGNLYGTTFTGGGSGCGGSGCGTVFKLTRSGTESVLHSFTGSFGDGAGPDAGLIADAAGNLYGTTEFGGGSIGCRSTIGNGCGTVFKLTPSGTETVLYSFTGGGDGAEPFAGLIADAAGNFYGTTSQGGASNDGTVFKLTPSGTETVLHSFTDGSDGGFPLAGLITDAAGNLYGTTSQGGGGSGCGDSGCGTVFEIAGSGFAVFAGTPGTPNCHGQSVSALAQTYGGLAAAAAALGYANVQALQNAIATYCAG